jgi:hypothetical protein
MVLAVLAWVVPVLGSGCRMRTTLVAPLPALVALALVIDAMLAIRDQVEYSTPFSIWVLIEIVAAAALIAIIAWEPEVRGVAPVARLVVVAWGTTAFGGLHQVVEYVWMTTFSDANWDVPPGTGYRPSLCSAWPVWLP